MTLKGGDDREHTAVQNDDGSYTFIAEYGYEYEPFEGQTKIRAYFEPGKVPTLEEVKEELLAYLNDENNEEMKSLDASHKEDLQKGIEALTEYDLTHEDNGLKPENMPALTVIPAWGSKEVGLSYSDFARFSITKEGWEEDLLFYGGDDDDHKIEHADVKNIDGLIAFKGKSFGTVEFHGPDDNDKVLSLEGDVNLTLQNGQSTLTANYDNWYDVKVSGNIGDIANTTFAFSNGDRISDADFKFHNGDNFNKTVTTNRFNDDDYDYSVFADIEYYGDTTTKSIEEAVGNIGYAEQPVPDTDYSRRFEMVFGAKKDKK